MKESITFYLKPNGNEIEKVREKSCDFLKSHGFPDKTVKEQIMILKELAKTCMNYTNFKTPNKKMTVQIHIDENKITLEVMKPVDETNCNDLKELDKTIQWIRGYQDPFEAFAKLKAASINSHCEKSNGMALARIAYEGNAILDFFVSEDNILSLLAVRNLELIE
jgi:hypothetical protein